MEEDQCRSGRLEPFTGLRRRRCAIAFCAGCARAARPVPRYADAAHERIGERIGLTLGRIARLAHRCRFARGCRGAARLHRVRDFVGDQSLTVAPMRIVGTIAKEHVVADRECACTECMCSGVNVGSGVDADAVEAGTEHDLEL